FHSRSPFGDGTGWRQSTTIAVDAIECLEALARQALLCFNSTMSASSSRFALTWPVLASLAAALLFGASTPLAKAPLASIGPLTLAGLLYLGGAIGAMPFARVVVVLVCFQVLPVSSAIARSAADRYEM